MEQYNRYLVISPRNLLAMVFSLHGFGTVNQTVPANDMLERGVPPAIVRLTMIRGMRPQQLDGTQKLLLTPRTTVDQKLWNKTAQKEKVLVTDASRSNSSNIRANRNSAAASEELRQAQAFSPSK